MLILKAQNNQLTKQNGYLTELVTKQAEMCGDVANVLTEAVQAVKDEDINKKCK